MRTFGVQQAGMSVVRQTALAASANTPEKAAVKLDLAKQIFGKEGEAKIESVESDMKFCLGLYADGLWERRNTDVGTFVHKKHDVKIPYLSKAGTPEFEYRLPKLPGSMLLAIATFFRKVMKDMANSEVMVQIWWDKSTEEYKIYVPVQRVAGASISFDHSEDLQNAPDMVWVIDIHSHNTMGAFFSGGDNADEKSTRVFGVLGKLNSPKFMHKWRAGVNGKFINLELDDIWDDQFNDETSWSIPDTVMENVTERKYTPVKPTTYGAYKAPTHTTAGGAKWVNKGQNKLSSWSGYGGYGSHYDPYSNSYTGADGSDDDVIYMGGNNMNHMEAITGIAHGVDYWDDPSLDLDQDVAIELELMHEVLDKAAVGNELGMCGHTELVDTVKCFLDYFSEFDSFDEIIGEAIVDTLSVNLKKDKFDSIIKMYSNEG